MRYLTRLLEGQRQDALGPELHVLRDGPDRLGLLFSGLFVNPERFSQLRAALGRQTLPHTCRPEITEVLIHPPILA